MVAKKKKEDITTTGIILLLVGGLALALTAMSIWESASIVRVVNDRETMNSAIRNPPLRLKARKETLFEPVKEYVPSYSEAFVLNHTQELGYKNDGYVSGCGIWNSKETYPELHQTLNAYIAELQNHAEAIRNFEPVPNLIETIRKEGTHDVCKRVRLHPDGLQGLFPSGQLSLSRAGYVEPMLPPFRSHKMCTNYTAQWWNNENTKATWYRNIMDMEYLVHDFEAMCLQLKPTSKVVLFDLGASLAFHSHSSNPMLEVMEIYEKFGFYFDDIYAFEAAPFEAQKVFTDLLPEKYLASYHWINAGVTAGGSDKMNPLHSILKKFNEDDLIIVKLDIDTPSLELPLVNQILHGGADGIYHKLIDQFYFEHHIYMEELASDWGPQVNGNIHDSLDIFTTLRKHGIASHPWP